MFTLLSVVLPGSKGCVVVGGVGVGVGGGDSSSSTSGGDVCEPIYQGIVERDISVIRKEAEIDDLKEDLAKLKVGGLPSQCVARVNVVTGCCPNT